MAPAAGSPRCLLRVEEEKMLAKEKNKLRKPAVEKMRRDRINHSIEQLKVLLEREFQRHQPNTKLEKADILETAVSYLKKQRQMHEAAPGAKHPELDFNTGYLRCLREAFYFLSFCQPKRDQAFLPNAQHPRRRHFLPPLLSGAQETLCCGEEASPTGLGLPLETVVELPPTPAEDQPGGLFQIGKAPLRST